MSPTTPAALAELPALDAEQAGAVAGLVARAAELDGDPPLSEQARLALRAPAGGGVRHLLATAGDDVVGYAQLTPGGAAGAAGAGGPAGLELVVDPARRRRGAGAALLAAAREAAGAAPLVAWAHGDSPAARALAARGGWRRVRELWRMELDLAATPAAGAPAVLPDGVALRAFEPGRDEAAWLALNAAAFAHHPEQGRWGPADLAAREAEPWFDPAGLLLLVEAGSGALLASHWTKVDPPGSATGEVYVVAVDPASQGRGLGRAVLAAGLHHLATAGVARVELYVDGDNAPARALYERLGFSRASTDVQLELDPARDGGPDAPSASLVPARRTWDDASMASTTGTAARSSAAPSPGADGAAQPAPAPAGAPGAPVDLSEQFAEHMADEAEEGEGETGSTTAAGPLEAEPPAPLPADRFGDRELSWLAFNERVLELAEDPGVPLLERTRFLAIFASNLDEFFMVRVAGLKRRIATGLAVTAASGMEPREVLTAISERAHALAARHAAAFTDQVRPALAAESILLVGWEDLSGDEQEQLHAFFRESVFPVLTPLAVDPAHPFPYISGLSLNLAVVVRNPVTEKEHFARVKVPPLLPRLVAVGGAGERTTRFVPLEDVIAVHLGQLFPGMEVQTHHTFRITRNEDLEVEEDDAENLLQALEKELLRRRFGPPVRLEIATDTDEHVRELLVRELGVSRAETYVLPAPLDLRGLNLVADLDRHELSFSTFVPKTHRHLTDGLETSQPRDVFAAVRSRDVLLHHPYDAFSTSVQAFLEQAAADPDVLAIKQTLYRTSGDSPIVDALIDAAEAGKQVLALVEIKARFDEQANISWARKLEQAGVHVVYGIVGLKTHAKLCLVVRQEGDRLRRYCHVGTGNYNPKTARLYEDVGLLTCDDEVGEDLTKLFNQLSGYAPRTRYSRLLVAPRSLRRGLVARIEREVEHAAAGRPAHIRIKVNSMVDEAVIDALYRASQAGVPVDVVVRGICALRPGVPGLSETIRVRSILGRYLEHSRVFAFEGGGDREVWIGSADMMHRNLDRRVEALVRLRDVDQQRALVDLVDLAMADTTASWHLDAAGTWTRRATDAEGRPLVDVQELYIATRSGRRPRRR